ncbi:MAG TPA: dipeptide ABC transporter ATP-binding protein [Gaiellaceae bacterium]|nr:dipeptide ABC transporter ATP-binding protein [Gaiellaceae bacterium]
MSEPAGTEQTTAVAPDGATVAVPETTAAAATASQNGFGEELLRVENLKKYFPITRGIVFQKQIGAVQAVDDVSFSVQQGETLGIVGESGCGKSTLARCVMRLLESTAGQIIFDGRDITKLSRADMRPVRRELMMIFQDPYSSLNPRKRVGFIVGEPIEVHGIGTPAQRKRRVQELLEIVGLNPEHYNRFPHEFSGGQRQRIGIARALAVNPKLVVCDEAVSALDVSVQAQILNLLKDLQSEFGLTYIFIAHDLNVVRHVSDRVMVMYLGKAVEIATKAQLYTEPKHPYTAALLSAVPIANPELGRQRKQIVLEGDVPNPINPPPACRFHTRCPRFVEGTCDVDEPLLVQHPGSSTDHVTACHFPLEKWPITDEEIRQTSEVASRPAEPVAAEPAAPAS